MVPERSHLCHSPCRNLFPNSISPSPGPALSYNPTLGPAPVLALAHASVLASIPTPISAPAPILAALMICLNNS